MQHEKIAAFFYFISNALQMGSYLGFKGFRIGREQFIFLIPFDHFFLAKLKISKFYRKNGGYFQSTVG